MSSRSVGEVFGDFCKELVKSGRLYKKRIKSADLPK